MNLTKVKSVQDYPIKQQQRKATDVFCAIIGIAFTVFIIIVCFIMVNYDHQIKTSFPSDSQGRVCGFDLPKFPFIYFTSFPKIQQRLCVSECPTKNDTRLNCMPTQNISCSFNSNPQYYVGFYQNEPQISMVGSFCVPKDQNLKQQFYKASNIQQRFIFLHNLSTILISCFIALGLGIIYTVLVQRFPLTMNKLALLLGCLLVSVMVIFVLTFPNNQLVARIIFSIVVLILLLTIYFTFKKNKGSLPIHGAYLKQATNVVSRNKMILAYIPIFMTAFVLFLFLIGFQLQCLWSSSGITFSSEYLYYQFKTGQTTFWTVIVFIQAVWGLSFIKQAFNFSISANSVQSCYSKMNEELQISQAREEGRSEKTKVFRPLKTLFSHHFGSVVAGSFLTGWFSLFDYIFDCLRPDNYRKEQNQGYFQKCINNLDNCLDLVRSDSMGYIYLTGNPYCNSSRYCQFLCEVSPLTLNSQSASRAYRMCAHFLLAGLVATVSILLQGKNTSVYIVVVVFLLSLFLTTFFISLHADSAESIQIVFLMDQYFAMSNVGEGQINRVLGEQVISNMTLRKSFARQIYHLYQANMEAPIRQLEKK